MLRASVERFGAAEAVVDGDVRLSYERLGELVDAVASAVVAAEVRPGDRVAIWAPNVHEWIAACLGALAAGAVLVPINTRFKGHEAAYILNRSGARMLFTVRGFLDTDYPAMLADQDTGSVEATVLLRGEAADGERSWTEFLSSGDEAAGREAARRAAAIGPEDLSDVIFTSGTTGRPKGVMCTHGQTLRVFEVWSRLAGLREGDRYLVVNPFFHTFGYKAGFLSALMRGAVTVPHAVFDAGQVLRRIGEERITMLPGPPTLYQSILDHPERDGHDLSSLRLAVTGAAVVPVELIRRMREELTFETVLTAYGLTESTGTATMCRRGDDSETIATTSGTAIPDTEVRVVGPDGSALPPGAAGEVVVRGYNVMRGYFEDPVQTAEAIDAEGWLHTGDVGVMDERGYLRITDRLKDMFIVGGFNAYPAEIEGELVTHPTVSQAAVVGAPDPRLGEVGVAFVVPRAGAHVDPEALIAWSRDRMANFKVPRRVEVVEALPVNASGKVLKYELRERARALVDAS
jgi:acyl-CoA synthetase (AMP-forming)/AMP-acid ligase II